MTPEEEELAELVRIVRRTREGKAPIDAFRRLDSVTDAELGGVPGRRDDLLAATVPLLERCGFRRPVIRDLRELSLQALPRPDRERLAPVIARLLERAGVAIEERPPEKRRRRSRSWRRSDPMKGA